MDVVDHSLALLLFAICDSEKPPTEDELANAVCGIIQIKLWKDEYERRKIQGNGTRHGEGLD